MVISDGFLVESFKDFLEIQDDADSNSKKLLDTVQRLAITYVRPRKYVYECKSDEEIEKLVSKGFIKGKELYLPESW